VANVHTGKHTQYNMAEEKKLDEKTLVLKTLVKEVWFPFLLKTSTSVKDSQMVCSMLAMTIQQAFLKKQKETLVKELELKQYLSEESESRYFESLDLLAELSIEDALRVLKDFPQAVDSVINEELATRTLESLKLDLEV